MQLSRHMFCHYKWEGQENKTKMAIETYQADNGLGITGIVDEETYYSLFPKEDSFESKSSIIPKPIEFDPSTDSSQNTQDTSGWAEVIQSMSDIDTDGDGYLSVDELFK